MANRLQAQDHDRTATALAENRPIDALPVAPGRLYFVVGASGVGKSSLLRWIRRQLPADARILFARRTITRAAHPSEDHEPISLGEFKQAAEAGEFSLTWCAHDLWYGIRRSMETALTQGRDVVIDGSRAYVQQLQARFPQATVIWIEADAPTTQIRLEERRRESGPALLRRMERASLYTAPDSVIRIDNSGPIEVAGQRLLALLQY